MSRGTKTSIGRHTPEEPLILTYDNDTVPEKFIDVRQYTMFSVTPPAALNGRTLTPMFANDEAGTGAAIPKYFSSAGTYAAMPGCQAETGVPIVYQADTGAGAWYFGLKVSGAAVTVTADDPVEVRPKG